MIEYLRQFIRGAGLAITHAIGTQLVDCKTGGSLGRVLMIPWRGRVHVIGLSKAVRPVFLPQKRITYWKQELGFTVHEPPDFEKLALGPQSRPDQKDNI